MHTKHALAPLTRYLDDETHGTADEFIDLYLTALAKIYRCRVPCSGVNRQKLLFKSLCDLVYLKEFMTMIHVTQPEIKTWVDHRDEVDVAARNVMRAFKRDAKKSATKE